MAAGFSALLDGRLAPVFDARDARDAAQRALDDSHGRIDRLTAEAAAARASLAELSSHPPVLAEVRSQTCFGRRGRSYDCTPSAALRGNASAQASYDSRLRQAQDAAGEAEKRLQADPGLKAEEEAVRASETRLRTADRRQSDGEAGQWPLRCDDRSGQVDHRRLARFRGRVHHQPPGLPRPSAAAQRGPIEAGARDQSHGRRQAENHSPTLKETVRVEYRDRTTFVHLPADPVSGRVLDPDTRKRHDRRTARFLTRRLLPALAAQSGVFARSLAADARRCWWARV